MRLCLVLSLCACACLGAADAGAFVEDPGFLSKISKAVTTSKVEELTPRLYSHDSGSFSYHLASVSYLGTLEHRKERVILATVMFMRSSAKDSIYPPGREHGYLVCLTADFKLVDHVTMDFPEFLYLHDDKLMRITKLDDGLPRGSEQVVDFTVFDEKTRSRGFLIEGDGIFMKYPFMDRIGKKDGPRYREP